MIHFPKLSAPSHFQVHDRCANGDSSFLAEAFECDFGGIKRSLGDFIPLSFQTQECMFTFKQLYLTLKITPVLGFFESDNEIESSVTVLPPYSVVFP